MHTVQENPSGRPQIEELEIIRPGERPLYRALQLELHSFETADIAPSDRRQIHRDAAHERAPLL
jgi:hypothetical protein